MKLDIAAIEASRNIKILYLTKSGSHLYGTNDVNSDVDYKGIYIPSKQSVLLKQDVDFIKFDTNTTGKANSKDDIDCHFDSLYKWLHLLEKGETNALDTLFSMWSSPEYADTTFVSYIKDNYLHLITSNPNAFVGYCVQQTRKYSIKGQRYEELVSLINYLKSFNVPCSHQISKLRTFIHQKVSEYKYISYVFAPGPRGQTEDWEYLEVLGKKFPQTVTLQYLIDNLEKIQLSYGSRVIHTTIDWKALSHAVRVILEIEELLLTNKIVFPLKDAKYIYSVKKGKVPIDDVYQLLTQKIDKVDELLLTTTLNKTVLKSTQETLILSTLY